MCSKQSKRIPVSFTLLVMRKLAPLALAGLFLIGCSGSPSAEPTPSPTPTAFDVTGFISAPEETYDEDGRPCTTREGYSDISRGAQVEIQDADGTVLALGNLESGAMFDFKCRFKFVVSGVPEGEQIYGVKVGNNARGVVKYEREQLAEVVQLNLG